MRSYIQDSAGNVIGVNVATFVKRLESTKIISKLYDGSQHIQTIGVPSQVADVTVDGSVDDMDALNMCEARAEVIRIVRSDNTYIGVIRDPIVWSPIIKGKVYEGSFSFIISKE